MAKAICGIFDCVRCDHRAKGKCSGCVLENHTVLAEGGDACGIYLCATRKNIKSCAVCRDAVCSFTRNLEMVCPLRGRLEKKRCYSRRLSEHFDQKSAWVRPESLPKIPEKTIDRLQSYLLALNEFISLGVANVSSSDMSRKTGVKDYLIRRDLSQFGEFGRPSIGYDAKRLRGCLAEILGLGDEKPVIWVGALHIAAEPGLLDRFSDYKFRIVAVADPNPEHFQGQVGGMEVVSLRQVAEKISETGAVGAIVAVSDDLAQDVTDLLVRAGIQGILNLAFVGVTAPAGVCVRNVNIVAELLTLSFICRRTHEANILDQDRADIAGPVEAENSTLSASA